MTKDNDDFGKTMLQIQKSNIYSQIQAQLAKMIEVDDLRTAKESEQAERIDQLLETWELSNKILRADVLAEIEQYFELQKEADQETNRIIEKMREDYIKDQEAMKAVVELCETEIEEYKILKKEAIEEKENFAKAHAETVATQKRYNEEIIAKTAELNEKIAEENQIIHNLNVKWGRRP